MVFQTPCLSMHSLLCFKTGFVFDTAQIDDIRHVIY